MAAALLRRMLTGAELRLLEERAQRRDQGLSDLLREALLPWVAPRSSRAEEAARVESQLGGDPLERLPALSRTLVLIAGETARRALVLWGRGRWAIGPRLLTNGRLRLRGPGRITIGSDVNAWARSGTNALTTFTAGASITVGDRVRLNGAGIQAATAISIGPDAILGSCLIMDTDHHSIDHCSPVAARPVRIGARAWIAGAVVLKGVSVGEGSVVGLGAVVTEDVPDGVVVAGNPARVVRRLLPA